MALAATTPSAMDVTAQGMHAVRDFPNGIDAGRAGAGGGRFSHDIAARIAFQLQGVREAGLRLPAVEHQDQVIAAAVDAARAGSTT